MALRWDLRPVFKNAPEDSDRANWTRRSVISAGVALTAFVIGTWNVPMWQYLLLAAAFVFAFDSGDMRVPFTDQTSKTDCADCGAALSPALMCWNYECRPERFDAEADDPDADRPLTDIELLYRPDNDQRHG